jgi:hypothetical protein
MDKNTKTLLGVSVVGVAGYYLYNNWKKAQAAPAPVAAAAFTGNAGTRNPAFSGGVEGDRMKAMVGLSGKKGIVGNTDINSIAPKDSRFDPRGGAKSWTGNQQMAASSDWVRADGGKIAGQFYNTQSTNW